MTNEFLSAILRTLRQHVEVWGCLNMMKTIAEALYMTHNFWKTRGVQSRDLLNLLLAIDRGQCLGQAAREQLTIDRANLVRVRTLRVGWSYVILTLQVGISSGR